MYMCAYIMKLCQNKIRSENMKNISRVAFFNAKLKYSGRVRLFSIYIFFFIRCTFLFFYLAHSQNFPRCRANTNSVYRVANILPVRIGKCYFARFQYPKPNINASTNAFLNCLDFGHQCQNMCYILTTKVSHPHFFVMSLCRSYKNIRIVFFFPALCFPKLIG